MRGVVSFVDQLFSQYLWNQVNVMDTIPGACQGGGPQFKYDYLGGHKPKEKLDICVCILFMGFSQMCLLVCLKMYPQVSYVPRAIASKGGIISCSS